MTEAPAEWEARARATEKSRARRNYSRDSSHAKVTDPCSRCGRAVKVLP